LVDRPTASAIDRYYFRVVAIIVSHGNIGNVTLWTKTRNRKSKKQRGDFLRHSFTKNMQF